MIVAAVHVAAQLAGVVVAQAAGQSDAVVIALAFFALVGTLAASWFAYKAQTQAKATAIRVDGRMDELLALTGALARAEGTAAGGKAERDRPTDPAAITLVANAPGQPIDVKPVNE